MQLKKRWSSFRDLDRLARLSPIPRPRAEAACAASDAAQRVGRGPPFDAGARAQLFGIPQPHVSELKNYKLNRFSSERLLRFVTLLDRDVEIIIRPKAAGHASGVVSVSVAT